MAFIVSPLAPVPVRKRRVCSVRRPRASAAAREGRGARWSRDGRDGEREREQDRSEGLSKPSEPPVPAEGNVSESVSTPGAVTSTQEDALDKHGPPTNLVDASGALQVDDGSLGTATLLPRKMYRRPAGKKLSRANARRQLVSGFDSGAGATLMLLALFATWYWANTAFNVYNKQVLKVFPYPLTCTVVQFVVGSLVMASLWVFRLRKPPVVNQYLFRGVAPLAACHAAGFLLTNMSLGKVSVAFTHTVKSTEPFFSVALTPSILGDIPTWGILVSLLPIVGGVGLASLTEASFNWIGFISAAGSNLALQSRNILSKKLMQQFGTARDGAADLDEDDVSHEELEKERTLGSLDNINLFTSMTMLALIFLLPVSLLWEGMPLLSSATSAAVTNMNTGQLYRMLAAGGICRCVDVLSSYMILKRVTPITHAVGNCVKRAVVIGFSVVFFQTKMSFLNIAGTLLALSGVMLYSLIVAACKQNTFGPESPVCKPIYDPELELTEGGGI